MTDLGEVVKPISGRPFVTIAIPTFNRGSWLRGCIGAALSQTYQNFEILISDNASTDDTAKIPQEFSDVRLRVLRQEHNIGLLPNWNTCVREAKGEYIVLVSDDDLISPAFLERCVGLLRQDPALPIVITLADILFFPEGRLVAATPSTKLATGICNGPDILCEYLNGRISAQICGMLIRTDVLRSRGSFRNDLQHTADMACWAPILLAGRAGFVNEGSVTFRVHDGARTSAFSDDALVADVRVVSELIEKQSASAIDDPQLRRRVAAAARLYVALYAIDRVRLRRQAGAGIVQAAAALWRWRNDLTNVGLMYWSVLVRPIGYVLLPKPLIPWFRSSVRLIKRLHPKHRHRPNSLSHH